MSLFALPLYSYMKRRVGRFFLYLCLHKRGTPCARRCRPGCVHLRIIMSSEGLFFLIIAILVVDFFFERYLAVLNIRHSRLPLPSVLQDVYEPSRYSLQQDYFRSNARFGMFHALVVFLVTLLMYAFGGFGWLDGVVRGWVQTSTAVSLVFIGILFFAGEILSLPFSWYATFRIEERFGFNRTTLGTFVTDRLKTWAVTLVVGGGLLWLVIWLYELAPDYFWLLAFGVVMLFNLFMSMFYSQVIVPLFNKQSPLPAGELRTAIERFASQAGFKLSDIYVIDGSKRTTKANAYFAGLGAKKRIVLYDTLSDTLSVDEIVAVLAHEIGHSKCRHTLVSFLLEVPYLLLLFFFFGWVLQSDAFAQALGGSRASFHLNALAFSILYSPVTLLLDVGMNVLLRRFEHRADAFAASYGLGRQLASALKKLLSSSLSNLMPHPLYVFFHYSHPTLLRRLESLEALSDNKENHFTMETAT